MGKFLVIVFLIVFAFWAYPHVAQAQWFAPTPTPSYWWGNSYGSEYYAYPGTTYQSSLYGSKNAGWFSFNFWSPKANVNVGYTSYPSYYPTSYYPSSYYTYSTCSYSCGYGNSYYTGYGGGYYTSDNLYYAPYPTYYGNYVY